MATRGPSKLSHEVNATSHHSSPTHSNKQTGYGGGKMQMHVPSGGSKVKAPAPVTKHSNPVGRPKSY